MNLCRCPHCQSTFQVNIPPDHPIWDRLDEDEEGLTLWVCLDCRHLGRPDVVPGDLRKPGHDTSFRGFTRRY
jgi:hypothetical protein